MNELIIVTIALIVMYLIYFSMTDKVEDNVYKYKVKNKVEKENADFNTDLALGEYRNNDVLLIDKASRKIAIGDLESVKIINSDSIIEAEIIQDYETISKTSRGSQLGGTVVGAVLLGGVGAIIGGLSAKKVYSKNIKNLRLKINISDLDKPIYFIPILKDEGVAYQENSIEYRNALKQAEEIESILKILIDISDKKLK